MFVVYERPKDYPDRYVLRKWVIGAVENEPLPTEWFVIADSLEAVRKFVPNWCVRIHRNEWDEPQIVESWI